jgi:hypothetical protein
VKHYITLALDADLWKKAHALAARRGTSVSAMLAGELVRMIEQEEGYEQSKRRALAHLQAPFHLGGAGIRNRNILHERQSF